MYRFSTAMFLSVMGLLAALSADAVPAQSTAPVEQGRLTEGSVRTKGSPTNVAALGGASVKVSKTAFVDGQNVCGAIRITNVSGQSAIVSGIADSLEVHFPLNAPPPALPAGSTLTWFKVADVPIPLPGPIAPGATATIDYCFSLCLATDAPGANAMRNVVAVTLANHSGRVNTVTTRSVSFAPPVLDCQACCLADGSCLDTLPDTCTADGGVPAGADTNCASTQCCIEFGASGCSADIECCPREGEGVPCNAGRCCLSPASLPAVAGCSDDSACCAGTCHDFSGDFGGGTGCCFELGTSGCSANVECCPRQGEGMPCNAGRCCLSPASLPAVAGCSDDTACCAGTCHDFSGDFGGGTGCCFEPGTSGCSATSECCPREGEGVPCNAGRCCLPPGDAPSVAGCSDDTICCAGTCHVFNDFGGGTGCCFEPGTSGCSANGECCTLEREPVPCNAGRCCLPPAGPLGIVPCPDDAACCAGTCHVFNDVGGRCCFELGASGCSADTQCCNSLDGATCNAGTCCFSTGTTGCTDSAQCCSHNAICGSGNTCCLPQFRPCSGDSDCCSGLVCTGGACEGEIGP